MESWEEAVSSCRQARLYHAAFTVVGKEVELDAIGQLIEAGVGVREIARLTRVPRSTVSRLGRDLVGAKRQLAIERAEVAPELLETARAAIRHSQLDARCLSDTITTQGLDARRDHGRCD